MGNAPSGSTTHHPSNDVEQNRHEDRSSYTLEDDVVSDLTDPTYPWLPIIECVAETLPSGVVRKYNILAAKTIILSASRFPLIVPDCIIPPLCGNTATPSPSRTVQRWSTMAGPWSKATARLCVDACAYIHTARAPPTVLLSFLQPTSRAVSVS